MQQHVQLNVTHINVYMQLGWAHRVVNYACVRWVFALCLSKGGRQVRVPEIGSSGVQTVLKFLGRVWKRWERAILSPSSLTATGHKPLNAKIVDKVTWLKTANPMACYHDVLERNSRSGCDWIIVLERNVEGRVAFYSNRTHERVPTPRRRRC